MEASIRQGPRAAPLRVAVIGIEDALRARELLTGYDRVFGVAHLLRFDARFAAAKRAIADGELGEILGMSFRRNSAVTGERHYGRFADVHVHVMVHDIDLAQWYTGSRAMSVYARSRSLTLRDIGAQDIVFATVEYENGVIACFEACWTLPRTVPFELYDTAEIIGTEGVVYIDSCAHGVSIIGERRVSSPDSRHWPEIGTGVGGAVQQEILEFVRCIIAGRPVSNRRGRKPRVDSCQRRDNQIAAYAQGSRCCVVGTARVAIRHTSEGWRYGFSLPRSPRSWP